MTSQQADDCEPTRQRTRRKVTQSRYGCFTCKARRVKCDETRPTCYQCWRLQMVCDGYPAQRSANAANTVTEPASGHVVNANDPFSMAEQTRNLTCSLRGGYSDVSDETRFALLGCEILARNAYININSLSQSVWRRLLPQMCYGNPLVKAAAAAFGATYAWRFLTSEKHATTRSVVSQYTWAIRSLRIETNSMSDGPVPLLLACILLGSMELLHRRQHNALTHLLGAFRILSLHESTMFSQHPEDATSDTVSMLKCSRTWLSQGDELILLLQCLDVQLATYRFTCPPQLRYARDICLESPSGRLHAVAEAYLRLIPTLNACYRFIAETRPYKYQTPGSLPHSLLIEQGRYIAVLHEGLFNLDNQILDEQHILSVESRALARILRIQYMSALINVHTAVDPQETSYDVHGLRFEQIIRDAAQLLDQILTSTPNPTHLSLGLGIAEALFLAACKYRHAVFRRQAIDLLRNVGREGPWEGRLLAAVAMRVVEIEEQQLVDKRSPVPEVLAESFRVHSCVMVENEAENSVTVDFSRCRNVMSLLNIDARVADGEDGWERWSETLVYTGL